MFTAICYELRYRGESIGFDLRPEGVYEPAIRAPPRDICRVKQAVGALKQLKKLANSVDVTESGRIHAVVSFYRTWLRHQIVKASFRYGARYMLSEATPGCDYSVSLFDSKWGRVDGIDVFGKDIGNSPPPKGAVRKT
jgi:hypothetical protein